MTNTKNFRSEEFQCHCCGYENISQTTVEKLQKARDFLNLPIHVTSGCRCPKHNATLANSNPNSSHIFTYEKASHAADVTLTRYGEMDGQERWNLLEALLKAGFKRIGIHAGYIHVDDDPEKYDKCVWV